MSLHSNRSFYGSACFSHIVLTLPIWGYSGTKNGGLLRYTLDKAQFHSMNSWLELAHLIRESNRWMFLKCSSFRKARSQHAQSFLSARVFGQNERGFIQPGNAGSQSRPGN